MRIYIYFFYQIKFKDNSDVDLGGDVDNKKGSKHGKLNQQIYLAKFSFKNMIILYRNKRKINF
jgi:hypothetical protein